MVGVILERLTTQVANLATLGNDANTGIIDQWFSRGNRVDLKTHPVKPRSRIAAIG